MLGESWIHFVCSLAFQKSYYTGTEYIRVTEKEKSSTQ